jgi:dTDP-glucose pyrophosphorylase
MLQVQGKPLLQHVLERLEAARIREFAIIVGYQSEAIITHFENWHLPITFLVQQVVNGTGAAALLAREFAADEPFLLTFGDILCQPESYLACMRALTPGTSAVIGVKDVEDPWQGAAVYEQAGKISRIIEKPPRGTSTTRWNSAGVFLYRPVFFDHLVRITPSVRGEYELTTALETMLDAGLELRIGPLEGDWLDVGRPEDLQAVNQRAE